MGFVFTKGYRVHDDRLWGADEFLRGSNAVNDVVLWRTDNAALYGAIATDADVVVIRPDTNTLVGWASLPGGFAKVARSGDDLFAVSKADPRHIYRLNWTTLSGDGTPAAWSPAIDRAPFAVADVHGFGAANRPLLAMGGHDGETGRVWVRDPATGAESSADLPDGAPAGLFPRGDAETMLFHACGGRLSVAENPTPEDADGPAFEALYGAIGDPLITAAAIQSGADTGLRRAALAFADGTARVLDFEPSNGGGYTVAISGAIGPAATDPAWPVPEPAALISGVALTDAGALFTAGAAGIDEWNAGALGAGLTAIAHRRRFDERYNHAQPLVDLDVTAIDARTGFLYGCRGDDSVYGYGAGAPGGAGYGIADHQAPVGTDAWAVSRWSLAHARIVTGCRTPADGDFTHAHAERRIDGGPWMRLTGDGWREPTDPNDHDADVAFVADPVLGDMGVVLQDEAAADGRYEYRWVFHDEAGNESALAAATAYGDGDEYVDTPRLTSLTLGDGAATTTQRGLAVRATADSGPATGARENRVRALRLWNDGEPESESPWVEWPATGGELLAAHRLSAGNGHKTVYARVRHECGRLSIPQGASVTLGGSPPSTLAAPFERVIICHGAPGAFNFTGDEAILTTNSQDDAFPASNVKDHDVAAPWKSDSLGEMITLTDGVVFQADLVFDLYAARAVEVFAVLGHNANVIAATHNCRRVAVTLAADDTGAFTDPDRYEIDLTDLIGRPLLLHRPQQTRRYWRLRLAAWFDAPSAVPLGTPPWSVGRVILNEAARCFTPAFNFEERWSVEHVDPTDVGQTLGQARRAVEREPYRRLELAFRDLSPEDAGPFETIWNLQRQIRPVLVLLNPGDIATGDEAPRGDALTDEAGHGAIYGYLGERLRVEGSGWRHADVRLSVDEAVG